MVNQNIPKVYNKHPRLCRSKLPGVVLLPEAVQMVAQTFVAAVLVPVVVVADCTLADYVGNIDYKRFGLLHRVFAIII